MNSKRTEQTCGLILAGGLSSRLGMDKIRLRLDGRQTFLGHAFAVMSACVGQVFISVRKGQRLEPGCFGEGLNDFDEKNLIKDEKDGKGPLEAVYSALKHLRAPVLVMPCDLPFMDATTMGALCSTYELARSHGETPYLTSYRQVETGYIEALVALYQPECLPFFEQARAYGIRQINQVIPETLQAHLLYTHEQGMAFQNINTPEDWAAAQRLYASQLTS